VEQLHRESEGTEGDGVGASHLAGDQVPLSFRFVQARRSPHRPLSAAMRGADRGPTASHRHEPPRASAAGFSGSQLCAWG
jgi:hypothetical protein